MLSAAGRERIRQTHAEALQRLELLLRALGESDGQELLRLLQRLNTIAVSLDSRPARTAPEPERTHTP